MKKKKTISKSIIAIYFICFTMSSATIASLQYQTYQTYLYGGLITLITGIIGEGLNILIFTTLKTFRKTTCGYYLTIVSIANFGQLIVGVLIRTLNYGFSIDLLRTTWLCKLREFSVPFFCFIGFHQYLLSNFRSISLLNSTTME